MLLRKPVLPNIEARDTVIRSLIGRSANTWETLLEA